MFLQRNILSFKKSVFFKRFKLFGPIISCFTVSKHFHTNQLSYKVKVKDSHLFTPTESVPFQKYIYPKKKKYFMYANTRTSMLYEKVQAMSRSGTNIPRIVG